MHILDLLMWIPCCVLIWYFIDWNWEGEYTQDWGTFIGLFILLIFTIVYIIIFGVYDNNWSDIHFGTFKLPKITW